MRLFKWGPRHQEKRTTLKIKELSVQDRLSYLVNKALQHSATDAELQELSDLLRADESGVISRQIEELLRKDLVPVEEPYNTAYWDNIASRILAADHPQDTPVVPIRRRWGWAVAAGIALLLMSGSAWWLANKRSPVPAALTKQQPEKDILPGGNKATLTLADGTEIPLDSAVSNSLAQQGNTTISKPGNGQLAYTLQNGKLQNGPQQYNTLRTPRGGQFQLQLPDGSKVWLNASSSLRYPTAFSNTRKVELTGEAYFEITPDAGRPFSVSVDGMEVQVLGTAFNVMAYNDEDAIKTTLLQGAVKVNSKRLYPGQGASLNRQNGQMSVLDDVNTDEVLAWKNGYIQFEGNDIRSVMRLIARWYDVEVVYKGTVAAHFRGTVPSNVPVSRVLKMLEMTGEVHFEIKGKQIIVSP